MKHKAYVDWFIAIIFGLILGAIFAGPAHAAQDVKSAKVDPGTGAEYVYIFEDKAHGVVCYETQVHGSISCVKLRDL